MVIGLIGGGDSALRKAAEGVEDRPERAHEDLEQIRLCDKDVLVGIATSGRTPYVIGGLRFVVDSPPDLKPLENDATYASFLTPGSPADLEV